MESQLLTHCRKIRERFVATLGAQTRSNDDQEIDQAKTISNIEEDIDHKVADVTEVEDATARRND